MRDAFIQQLTLSAAEDPSIFLITGDLGFGVLTDFAQRFPQQFLNVGVAEQNMTGVACGLALEGHRVFTYSIGNFPTLRPLEQIRNDVCYHEADVTVVCVGAGFSYGQLGMSHFATEDLAIMRAIPNIKIFSPSDPWETGQITRELTKARGPNYLRLDKSCAGIAQIPFTLGQIHTIRQGTDVTIIGTGGILKEAITAADHLNNRGIQARVLAVHSLKPLDKETIQRAAIETGGIITIEEHTIIGGLGSAVGDACLESNCIPKFFHKIGLDDTFPTIVGDQSYLRREYGLTSVNIVETVISRLK